MKPEVNANRRVEFGWQAQLVRKSSFSLYILWSMGPGWIRRHTTIDIHEAIHRIAAGEEQGTCQRTDAGETLGIV